MALALLNWIPVGIIQLERNAAALYKRYGSASAHVVSGGDGVGLETPFYALAVTPRRRFCALQFAVFVRSGVVRCELVLGAGAATVVISPTEARTSALNIWTDGDKSLGIAGLDLHDFAELGLAGPVDRFAARVLAHGAAAEFFLDAAMFTQDASGHSEYFAGRASNDLHRAANRYLREFGMPRNTYRGSFVDLQRIAARDYPHDALRIGADVRLYEPELESDLLVRVNRVQRNRLVPGDSSVELATPKPDLTQVVVAGVRTPALSSGSLPQSWPPSDTTPWVPVDQPLLSAGALSNVSVSRDWQGAENYHRVRWDHTAAVEAGGFTVRIFRSIDSGAFVQLVAGRDARLEFGGTNSQAGAGSYRQMINACPATTELDTEGCEWQDHRYRVELWEGAARVDSQEGSIFGSFLV